MCSLKNRFKEFRRTKKSRPVKPINVEQVQPASDSNLKPGITTALQLPKIPAGI